MYLQGIHVQSSISVHKQKAKNVKLWSKANSIFQQTTVRRELKVNLSFKGSKN